jgi:N-acylneuraminate cytidylyltransferase
MDKVQLAAIIPVRAGSRRLVNKNILPFADSNLLVHKIRQLKQVAQISEIVVSSDSELMLEMAKNEGCLIHKRGREYADERTKSFGEVVHHVVEEATKCENVMWAPCVCPLVDASCFKEAISLYNNLVLNQEKYDSLISCKLFKEYLWNEKGPENYKLGLGHVPSQLLPDWQIIINGFYIARRKDMIKWNYFFGENPYRLTIEKIKTIDIDDKEDFWVAEALYNYMQKIPPIESVE